MDIAEKAQFFTLDTIMDIATGVPIGDLENDKDVHNYLKTTADALPSLFMLGSIPAIARIFRIPFIAKLLFPTAEDELGLGRLIGFVKTTIDYFLILMTFAASLGQRSPSALEVMRTPV